MYVCNTLYVPYVAQDDPFSRERVRPFMRVGDVERCVLECNRADISMILLTVVILKTVPDGRVHETERTLSCLGPRRRLISRKHFADDLRRSRDNHVADERSKVL